jgi:hypothetical protein
MIEHEHMQRNVLFELTNLIDAIYSTSLALTSSTKYVFSVQNFVHI